MKENQRIELTKRLLQEGLLRLLKTKPLEKISVTELCSESGINRATFYRHYGTPRDVLLETEKHFSEEVYELYALPVINDVPSHLESFCTYLYEHADIVRLFIKNSSEDDLLRMTNDMFKTLIEKQGYIRPTDDIDDSGMQLILTFVVGGGYHVLRRWLTEDVPKSPKEITRLFLIYMEYSYTLFKEDMNSSKP